MAGSPQVAIRSDWLLEPPHHAPGPVARMDGKDGHCFHGKVAGRIPQTLALPALLSVLFFWMTSTTAEEPATPSAALVTE